MAHSIKDLLTNADYVIITNNYQIKKNEDVNTWLRRCYLEITVLSVDINKFCSHKTVVIFSHPGCTCFNATILLEHSVTVLPQNILAITAHEGILMLGIASSKADIPVSAMNCPIVWGAPGLVSYVDLSNTICLFDVYQPFSSSANFKHDVIPKGTVQRELRLLENHMSTDEKVIFERTKVDMKSITESCLNKSCIALFDLLLNSKPFENIISLGVVSKGGSDIPCNMIFSQPAYLNKEKKWIPCNIYPVPVERRKKVQTLVSEFEKYLKSVEYAVP